MLYTKYILDLFDNTFLQVTKIRNMNAKFDFVIKYKFNMKILSFTSWLGLG